MRTTRLAAFHADLKLDYDDTPEGAPTLPANLVARVRFVLAALRTRGVLGPVERTAHGYHVTVRVARRLGPVAVVAVQACLGSDLKRETFNLARALEVERGGIPKFWRERANVLYRRKVGGRTVQA